MTSRRKAKRVDWIYYPKSMFVREDDGTLRPLDWRMKWYQRKLDVVLDPISAPDKMWGCVKKAIQQRYRGSWNLIGIDTWYGKGYISWSH